MENAKMQISQGINNGFRCAQPDIQSLRIVVKTTHCISFPVRKLCYNRFVEVLETIKLRGKSQVVPLVNK